MNDYILIVKGDKGLYYSDGKKFYFPDKTSFKDATEGVAVHCHITKDSGNFVFFTGEMLNRHIVSATDADISKYLDNNMPTDYTVERVKIAGIDAIRFINFSTCMKLLIKLDNVEDLVEIYMTDFTDEDRSRIMIQFGNISQCQDITNNFVIERMFRDAEDLTFNDIRVLQIRANASNLEGYKCCLLDNKVLLAQYASYPSVYYKIDDKFARLDLYSTKYDDFAIGHVKKDLSNVDLKEFMLDNCIRDSFYSKESISKESVTVFGQQFDYLCFNSSSITSELLNPNSEEYSKVQKSFNDLDEIKRRYAKNCSRSMISELHKLSKMELLNLN